MIPEEFKENKFGHLLAAWQLKHKIPPSVSGKLIGFINGFMDEAHPI